MRYLLLLLTLLPFANAQNRNLEIYWIDVEGGASTLLITPSGESLLIDTGWAQGGRDAKLGDVLVFDVEMSAETTERALVEAVTTGHGVAPDVDQPRDAILDQHVQKPVDQQPFVAGRVNRERPRPDRSRCFALIWDGLIAKALDDSANVVQDRIGQLAILGGRSANPLPGLALRLQDSLGGKGTELLFQAEGIGAEPVRHEFVERRATPGRGFLL